MFSDRRPFSVRQRLRGLLAALALVLALPGLPAMAADAAVSLAAGVSLREDPQGRLEPSELLASPEGFTPWAGEGEANAGFSGSTWWVRVRLPALPPSSDGWVLEIPYAQLDRVELHRAGAAPAVTGSAQPVSSRPIFHRYFAFRLPPGELPEVVLLKVSSSSAVSVPLSLWRARDFDADRFGVNFLQAVYYGGALALMLYNAFLALALRDGRFMLYASFIGFMGLAQLAGNGFGRLLLWPDHAAFDAISAHLLMCMTALLGVRFSRAFLCTAVILPRVHRVLGLTELVFVACALALAASLRFALPAQGAVAAMMLAALPAAALVLYAGVHALRRDGSGGVRFFVLAWGLLWTGAGAATLRAFGWLPTNTVTAYALQIASAAEMLLLALALADRVREERAAREAAQDETLIAQRDLLQVRDAYGQRLAQAVSRRTDQLLDALTRERETLAQYRRFGAMITHEFRNRLSVVDSQASMIGLAVSPSQDRVQERLGTIRGTVRRLSVLFDDWLQDDRMLRAERATLRTLDLSAWLGVLVQGPGRGDGEHPVRLAGDPSPHRVLADTALLEIAVTNLLDNACRYSATGTPVTIALARDGDRIGITVSDEGRGIAPEHHATVFEPGFQAPTDAPRGGTGLGLSLVRRIATLHGGSAELVHSRPGEGSTFRIWLPVALEAACA